MKTHTWVTQTALNQVSMYNATSKEKHSLTRKLVGYRNWRKRWCIKEGNKVLGKRIWYKNLKFIFSTSFGSVTFTRAKYKNFVSFSFSQNLVPFLFTPLFLQFLYPTNFLVRECFSLLVSSIFFIVDDICEYCQVLTSYSYDIAFLNVLKS